ncbi:pectinesterase [Ranunculus cassubicifolius]
MVNGEPVIHLQSTQFGKIQQKNEGLVIGSFVTKRESFEFVQSIVKKAWKPKGKVTMKFYGRKSFSFAFEDEEDKAQALEFGNFHIASQLFLVRPWKLFVEADLKNLETIPIWVLFKKIPEELWDDEGFSRVASAIGRPLYADRKTELKTKTDYARICIEVKATSTFPTAIPVVVDKKRVFRVSAEYNWRPPRCTHCKVFGHSEDNCPKHKVQQKSVWIPKEASIENLEGNESAKVMEAPEGGEVAVATGITTEGRGKAQQHTVTSEEARQEKENNGDTATPSDIAAPPPQPTKQINEWITPGKKNIARRSKSPKQ